jgi:hypothetical protein
LVIHNGKDTKSSVGVIIEAKSPTNKSEMISEKNLNSKALQELVLYFLRERITHKNLEIKNLVATYKRLIEYLEKRGKPKKIKMRAVYDKFYSQV